MKAQLFSWNDLNLVLAVCREGSLSAAARKLEINHSTVFRRVAALEAELGVRLFERLSSGYVMTEAGEAVLESGERVENEIFALSRKLMGQDLRLTGTLRITATEGFARNILMPYLAAFSRACPEINIELSATSHLLDLMHREADIAIRSTRSPPDAVIGRELCKVANTFYASRAYLERKATMAPEEFEWLMPDDTFEHSDSHQWLQQHYPRGRVKLRTNTFSALLLAAQQDLGVAPLPCFLGDTQADLVRVFEPPAVLESAFWMLIHPDLRRTVRVRAFSEFLTEALQQDIDLIEGRSPPQAKQ